jgi:hypothetical protein
MMVLLSVRVHTPQIRTIGRDGFRASLGNPGFFAVGGAVERGRRLEKHPVRSSFRTLGVSKTRALNASMVAHASAIVSALRCECA